MSIRAPVFTVGLDPRSNYFGSNRIHLQRRYVACSSVESSDQEADQRDVDGWDDLAKCIQSLESRASIISRLKLLDLDSVINLILKSNKIVVLLGAGGSVGPDFRSPGGLYDSIAKVGVLQDPSDVFDLGTFLGDPSIFWSFAHTVFPSRHPAHSGAHYFISELHKRGKLLRLYSQNVDALEVGVPSERLRCVHGSWRECQCQTCGRIFETEELRPCVERREVPTCSCGGCVKPGIVFFGQPVNLDDTELAADASEADLLLIIGTSLRVAPVSGIPGLMSHVPSVLINRAPVKGNFCAELLGECDDVVDFLQSGLGWSERKSCSAVHFYQPNKFIFPSKSELATRVLETPCEEFLISSVPVDVEDLA